VGLVDQPLADTITVSTSGVYEITATLASLNPGGASTNYDIRRNNVIIPGARFLLAGASATIAKTIQIALVAGDILTVVPSLESAPSQYASAALTVNLIGP